MRFPLFFMFNFTENFELVKMKMILIMRSKRIHNFLFVIFFSILIISCSENQTPKPKGYFRIDLPEKKYTLYQNKNCPFQFDLPVYAEVVNYRDSMAQPCWKYIRYPRFNAEIFLSYKAVNNNIDVYLEDTRTLAYKHTVKADAIDETLVTTKHGVSGMIYDIGGNAASSVQFYATDSTKHFIRGALYFNVTPQPDSLAPVIKFLREDIVRLMGTLEFGKRDGSRQ